jgi:hypothetical protein
MLSTLLLSLTLSAAPYPALRLQAPDWSFVAPTPAGDSAGDVAEFLAQLDATARGLDDRKVSPFEDGPADPFDATPADDARETAAAFAINAVLDALDELARP